ncbi:MAG: hypothetical protein K9M99_09385 [Candidatus Cloacimonetes bacterium]|nr:hypothetical protein [Candidatus Cloacimonadota bacterium]
MKNYSKTRKEYGAAKPRKEATPCDFIENYCDIHGRLGDTIYRHKRNGELYKYPYKYVPKYQPTVLSRRSECVMREINILTNKHRPGFKEILHKLYYYTPYFIYPGSYSFTCDRFLKIRRKGEYLLQVDDGLKEVRKLAPRSKLKYPFEDEGEHIIRCYTEDGLYCERKLTVISEEQELEDVYADWYAEHLAEILALPDPRYEPLEKYIRCVIPSVWFTSLTGKLDDIVFYSTPDSHLDLGKMKKNFMYTRKMGSYEHNAQSHYFLQVQPRVNVCWKGIRLDCRNVWEKFYNRWFDKNYMKGKHPRAVGPHNLWSRLLFRAAKVLGFDLETLSVEHFLSGVETIGELLSASGVGSYGLTQAELRTKIY